MGITILTGCTEKKINVDTTTITLTKTTSTSASTTTTTTTRSTTKKTTTTTTSCKEKKFSVSYQAIFATEKECISNGNHLINDSVIDVVNMFDCEVIKDECGTSWYSIVFYNKYGEKVKYPKNID